ncbi:hypothetical protein [Anaerotignum neopropionicum]|uniref:hypothetical protein n=1 Tax=Anaerotignum neopropionicum TaxID=36847 RepID=UPI0008244E6F|nr:hypothetical protein [Anaerotignum neopropionicum]
MAEITKPKQPNGNSISLRNVTFRYRDAKINALDGIHMEIKNGEHVPFVRPSGGGKTTLASVIVYF